ncbi:MAG TPA: hypothetical protein VHV55_16635 [Pirellulales bacterium]|jgi:hypothetical protein|nr:hypothetical protein [Pirellulales bacterium]
MHSSNLYATDGLLILGVVLVCVTIYSGLRGLYGRSAAVAVHADEDIPGERLPGPPRRPTMVPSTPRRAA